MSDFDDLLKRVEQDAAGLPEPPEHKASLNGSGRNVTLTRVAGSLASQGRPLDEVEAGVDEANANFAEPLPEREVNGIKRSAQKWIRPDADKETPEHIEDSDIGNARHFAEYVSHRLLWDGVNNLWMFWDGTKWIEDTERRFELFLPPAIDRMYQQAVMLPDERRQRRMKFLTSRLRTRQAQSAMIEGAKAYLPVSPTDFDSDPYEFGFSNGVFNLKTGRLSPPDPRRLISKTTEYAFDPKASCPQWLAFLEQIFEGDEGLIRALQMVMGEALSGETGKSIFVVFYGEGANGKSTVIYVMGKMLGDYARHAKADLFASKDSEAVRWDYHDLVGARLVSATESEKTRWLAEGAVKAMTGDDQLRAEKKYGSPFSFRPQFLPVLATNAKPRIRGANEAIWRRVRLVPFDYTIPEAERVKGFAEKRLLPELPGIFLWAYEGFKAIQAAGGNVDLGDRVRRATESYRDSEDILGEWLGTRTAQDPESKAPLKDVYASYVAYADDSKDTALGKRTFQDAMAERGFPTEPGAGRTRYITGLKLLYSS